MVEATQSEIILITGITGYIGSHVGLVFLDKCLGTYKIRASVRSLANLSKLEPLKFAFGEERFNQIQFVEADLNDEASLERAVEGVSYIIQVASPIPGATTPTEAQMIAGATTGMKAIINASVKNKVKRLVVTSSVATIIGGVWKASAGDPNYTEADVAPAESADSYAKSKIA